MAVKCISLLEDENISGTRLQICNNDNVSLAWVCFSIMWNEDNICLWNGRYAGDKKRLLMNVIIL